MNPAVRARSRASRPGGPFVVTSPYLAQVRMLCGGKTHTALFAPSSPCFHSLLLADPVAAMGAGPSQEAAVWPTGWCVASIAAPASLAHYEPVPLAHRSEIPAEQRLVARQAILQISTVPREEFLAIETEHYCISHDDWSFEAYHGAAAAAVQEDKGLNRMIYCIVPRCAAPPAA